MELASGLSLTILLVMYTMYQSISQTLTKTAYLKMIDYWLIFCLLVPFLIFMIEMYWLLQKNSVEEKSKKCWTSDTEKKISSKVKVKYFIFMITILFMTIYTLAALFMSFGII